jgi:hypothetical protein
MNCVELQQSLAESEDGSRPEQRGHLRTCPDCTALVAELNAIISSASELREVHEPSPRVWNSIEIALRQEGLIRPQRPARSLLPSFGTRWAWARWMAPAAAMLIITAGIYVKQNSLSEHLAKDAHITNSPVAAKVTPLSDDAVDLAAAGLNDDDLLQEVSNQSAGMRAQYADNLRHVNEYIQDAKSDVRANPNDEEARRSLMAAYQEKAMLFEMAMDRSLP